MNFSRALSTLSVAALARRGVVLWSAPSEESLLFHSTFAKDGTAYPLDHSLRLPVDDVAPGHGGSLRYWLDGGCQGTLVLPFCPSIGTNLPVFLRRLPIGGVMHGSAELDRGPAVDFWGGGFRHILLGRLSEAVKVGRPVIVGLITIRSFSFVRDGAGHAVAQAVMADLHERLVAIFGPDADIGPFQSDVFAFITRPPTFDETPEDSIRRKIGLAFAAPFEIDCMTYRLTANAGIAVFPDDCDNVDDLLRAAEIALDRAKHSVPDTVIRCQSSWLENAKGSLMMAVDIYTGITNNTFVPYLQPIIDLRTGKAVSAEVLVRWRHPIEGILSPDRFIPIAEHHGLITDMTIGLTRQLGRMRRDYGLPPHRLSINLSATDLTPSSMRRILNDIDNESMLPSDMLTFEITETAIASEPDVARSLLEFVRQRGTRVAIDDFGVGYSCFGSLGSMPVDYLKIDRSFVTGVEDRPERRRLVSAICAMSSEFGLTTVAEGVETEISADTLRAVGCTYAQGYYYAKPMPMENYNKWLFDREQTEGEA